MMQVKGYAAQNSMSCLAPYAFERRELRDHDVCIEIKYCGICHSDIHQTRNDWGSALFPMVPGHEITGIVNRIGSKVTKFKLGDRVGVGVMVDSCRECASCKEGLEQYCLEKFTDTYSALERDGKLVTQGGYSDKIVVDENYVLKIPANLPLADTAPLLCAGITLYSPMKYWEVGPGKKVAILGFGGLGHIGVKIARALGAQVTVLNNSTRGKEDALKFGATQFYSTLDPETFVKLNSTFDILISTASSEMNLDQFLSLVKTQGTMVLIGIPPKPHSISTFSLALGRKALGGSLIGGIKETQEMLDFCGKHNIVSEIETTPIQRVNEAYERVLKSDVRYRFVIDMASLE